MDATRVKEVYVRQLSGNSLELFFRHHLYTCQSKFGPNALQHQYFAPLFTARAPSDFASRSLLPIEKGLSHIARIREGRVLPRAAVLEYLQSVDHPNPKEAASQALKKDRGKDFTLLVLGPPIQLFPTPLSPHQLGVRGMLAQRTFTFEDLLLRSRVSG